MAALVDGVITGITFAKMRVKPYLVAAGSTRTKANGAENSRRLLGHERKTLPIPIFLHCLECGVITRRLAQHDPKAILREVGAQHNEFSIIKTAVSMDQTGSLPSYHQALLAPLVSNEAQQIQCIQAWLVHSAAQCKSQNDG